MPNDCWCKVRIGADKEQITTFCETEFSFEKLRPRPEGVDWYVHFCQGRNDNHLKDLQSFQDEWNTEHWGTKWDRSNYKLKHKGQMGMEIQFTTAWGPPYEFLVYLVETYHDVWIKCDWSEEGGGAGVMVMRWDEESEKVDVKGLDWDDWCLEEWAHRFRD